MEMQNHHLVTANNFQAEAPATTLTSSDASTL